MDTLNWEVQRLQVENRRLSDQEPEAGERVDREAELERARADVTERDQRIEALEQQLADGEVATAEATRRASEAEDRVAELSERLDRDDGETAGGGADGAMAQLEEVLRASRDRVQELETELALAEERRSAAEEAVERRAELERFRALESERQKWEKRESRLYARLEAVEEELRTLGATAADERENEQLRERMSALKNNLGAMQELVETLRAENSRLLQENTERSEESLAARGRLTEVTRSQLGNDLGEGGGRERVDRAQRGAADGPPLCREESYGYPLVDAGEGYSGPRRADLDQVFGREQTRSRCRRVSQLEDSRGGPTVTINQTVPNAQREGTVSLTDHVMSSTNRPRTVTFSGPIPLVTVGGSPGTLAMSVSGSYKSVVSRGPLGSSLTTHPPCPAPDISAGHTLRSPTDDSHPTSMVPSHSYLYTQPQCRLRGTTASTSVRFRDGLPQTSALCNTVFTQRGVASDSVWGRNKNFSGVCASAGSQSGVDGVGDRVPCSGRQTLSLPAEHVHQYLSPVQDAPVTVTTQLVTADVTSALPGGGIRGSHPTHLPTSTPYPPSVGEVAQPQVSGDQPMGLTIEPNLLPQPPPTALAGMSSAHHANGPPAPDVASTGATQPPATTMHDVTANATVPPGTPAVVAPAAFCPFPLMGQVPQIPRFTGEGRAIGESFGEWHEHFENVAMLAGWNDHWKLVHLTSNLGDTALAFYRSCASDVRSKYSLLVAAMKRRFTPIRLTAVQAQLFHNRQQHEKETVDQFAQEIQKLYNLAYAGAASEGPQAERMGQTLLANQFVTGLRPELKRKLIGTEGSLDELVLKARFEEAKAKEFLGDKSRTATMSRDQRHVPTTLTPRAAASGTLPSTTAASNSLGGARTRLKCYNCGLDGHMARSCPYPRKNRRDDEARGPLRVPGQAMREQSQKTVSALAGEEEKMESPADQLSKRLQELEEKLTREDQMKVLNSVAVEPGEKDSHLGPSVMAKVCVNGVPTSALIDTGSPASVVSLEFVLDVFVKGKRDHQTPAQWREETSARFQPPSVLLKAYSGHKLDITSQVNLQLTHGSHIVEATVLVQAKAPHELLLGTDLQTKLGFALVSEEGTKFVDLLTGGVKSLAPRVSSSAGGAATVLNKDTPLRVGDNTDVVMHDHNQESLPFSVHPEIDDNSKSSPSPQVPETGVVRLLNAVKVPPGYQKPVRARICGKVEHSLLLFTPQSERALDLLLADGAIQGGGGSRATIVLENHGLEPVRLRKGTILGTVVPVEEVNSKSQDGEEHEEGTLRSMEAQPTSAEQRGPAPSAETPSMPLESQVSQSGEDGGDNWDCLPPTDDERIRRLLEQLSLAVGHLAPSQREKLIGLITSYSDIFALDPMELGTTTLVQHVINTGDHAPIRQPVRRMPFALRKSVDDMVGEMLDQGVIQPSHSPWASPIVLVRKKDGGVRFCVDYRRLNHITKLDEFPLPRIDDTLDLLAGAQYFTTLDLASGYWQVKKTAFATYSGLYEFRKMPFGLVNAPATFQRLMEVVLSGLARGSCHVYLDDVLVFGRTAEEHNTNLARVFDRIRGAGLRLKPKKCEFARESVVYLGHVVSAEGVKTDPEKLRAVACYPPPGAVKPLRSFLGLASYYRRFVPRFSTVASPLHALTRKDVPYVWTPACQQAFEKLKELLTSAPLLRYPDFKKPFILETDASGDGLGAVLAQRQEDGSVRPIAYASRSLQKHEKNYGITELEGLGVVWAAKHFRPYIYGHQCTVFTDHEALKSLLNTPQPSGKLARWGMVLQELNLTIQHRAGKHNANADALSRYPLLDSTNGVDARGEKLVAALTMTEDGDGEDTEEEDSLASMQHRDPELAPLIVFLETGTLPPRDQDARQIVLASEQFTLEEDVLYYVENDGTLRVVPPVNQRERLVNEAHSGKFGAHLGDAKVYSEIKKHYWWRGMRRDITRWTRGCIVCATRSVGRAVKAPLTPIPVDGPFDRIGVDVIQFPKTSRGNQYAVVFVDYLTKWPEVFAVPDQSAATIARLLVEEIVSRHGVPSEILSDRGRAFLSGLMQEVQHLLGFKKVNTTAYHPQTDGLVERYNRTLTAMLAKTVEKRGLEWDERLPYVLFAYRACQQASTRESPFFLLYGRDPRLPVPAALSPKGSPIVRDLKEYGVELYTKMSEAWEAARQQVTRAQRRQKQAYDRRAKIPFQAGERVFLFKPAEQTGARRKFARPFHGPYRIAEIGTNTARIRPVDQPESEPLLVALDRLRRCPDEVGDKFWPPFKKRHKPCSKKGSSATYCKRGLGETQKKQQCPGVTLDLCSGPDEYAQVTSGSANCSEEAGATDSTRSGGEGLQDSVAVTGEGAAPRDVGSASDDGRDTLPTDPIENNGHDAARATADQPVGGDDGSTRLMQDTPTAVSASGPQGVAITRTRESARGGLSPRRITEDENVSTSTDPRKRRRRRWVDSPSSKWAGQLRGQRSPRTATSKQGEM